jgi:GNAT superfamily N-acetyltransferase
MLCMVLIRKACRQDLRAVADLHGGEHWCYDDEVILNDYWDDSFEKDSIIVAEIDSKIVGTIELTKAYKARFGFFGVLRRFVVHPDYRGRGVGKALMQHALEETKKLGCNALELSVDPANEMAHKYYLSLGFCDDRTETIMVKTLQQ